MISWAEPELAQTSSEGMMISVFDQTCLFDQDVDHETEKESNSRATMGMMLRR